MCKSLMPPKFNGLVFLGVIEHASIYDTAKSVVGFPNRLQFNSLCEVMQPIAIQNIVDGLPENTTSYFVIS